MTEPVKTAAEMREAAARAMEELADRDYPSVRLERTMLEHVLMDAADAIRAIPVAEPDRGRCDDA